jgi:prolyl oligopeptidase
MLERGSYTFFAFFVICWSLCIPASAQPSDLAQLKWLEEVTGERALQWVNQQNSETQKYLRALPDFQKRYSATLAAASSAENIQFVQQHGDYLYSFYTNLRNPHGVWRRTTLVEYRKARPQWQILINLDEVARQEARNWVMAFTAINPFDATRALVHLSDAGKDEVVVREFDLEQLRFVEDGFISPVAKQRVAWISKNEILVATDFGANSLTKSGYAAQVRLWKRGQALNEATLLLQAAPTDVLVSMQTDESLGAGRALLTQRVQFHDNIRYFWDQQKLHRIDLPLGADAWISNGFIVAQLKQNWSTQGRIFTAGSVIAAKLNAADLKAPLVFHSLFEAQERSRAQRTEPVKSGFAVLTFNNMQPVLELAQWNGNGFDKKPVSIDATSMASIALSSTKEEKVWLMLETPIEPRSYGLLDMKSGIFEKIKQQKEFFDAKSYVVERFEVKAADGTAIPYTMIRHKDKAPSPAQPTLLYGYGGFGISLEMSYQREVGLNWLDFGGIYVMAHIRGGGEFGEAWRQSALREKRPVSYEDFMTVAQDLIERGFTTPKRLGIYGASNGGVLVSTVMARKPELFGAVVSRVPLTDMLGYTELFAGPSWVAETGDPSVPKEREVLAAWSPLHNVKPGISYPPTLLVGNQNDDRVHPAHARKFAHRLQEFKQPAWLIEAKEGGHSGRTTPELFATREALLYTFLMHTLTQK